MSAFNHRFKALDERHAWRGHSDQDPGRKCSRCKVTTSRPKQTAVILACYDYVTGKAGRVTSSEVNVCREHAESFAIKYKLQLNAPMLGLKHYFIKKMKDFVVTQCPLRDDETRAWILTWEEGGTPQTPSEAGVHQVCHQIRANMEAAAHG